MKWRRMELGKNPKWRQSRQQKEQRGKDWYGDGGLKNLVIWFVTMQKPVILVFQAKASWF